MAKPNEKQLLVLDYLSTQIEYWKSTNDLSSPTHQGDMEEEIFKLDDILDETQEEDLLFSLNEIIKVVRTV